MSEDQKNNDGSGNSVGGLVLETKDVEIKSRPPTAAEPVAEEKKPDAAKPSFGVIMVVEDSKPNAAILAVVVKNLGFEVVQCEDGEVAWKTIADWSQEERLKLKAIFSDVMMPKMDGLELLEKVRSFQDTRATPFIICTAVGDKTFISKAASLNASGYLLKPLTADKIKMKLASVLHKKNAA